MIKFDYVITNGSIDIETINGFLDNGWAYVVTLPAQAINPFSADNHKATIFSKIENVYSKMDDLLLSLTSEERAALAEKLSNGG